jgi:hypothetical protein
MNAENKKCVTISMAEYVAMMVAIETAKAVLRKQSTLSELQTALIVLRELNDGAVANFDIYAALVAVAESAAKVNAVCPCIEPHDFNAELSAALADLDAARAGK